MKYTANLEKTMIYSTVGGVEMLANGEKMGQRDERGGLLV